MSHTRKQRFIDCLTRLNEDGSLTRVIQQLQQIPPKTFENDMHFSIIIGNIALDKKHSAKLINNPELKTLCDEIQLADLTPRLGA